VYVRINAVYTIGLGKGGTEAYSNSIASLHTEFARGCICQLYSAVSAYTS